MEFSELLRAAKEGEEQALAQLHDRYVSRVCHRIRTVFQPTLRRRYDTVDLGQSVFLEVLRDLPRFEDRGEEAFRNWLYIKAENKVRMKLRRVLDGNGRSREAPLPARDEGLRTREPGPATRAGAADDRERLAEVLTGLADAQREVLLLRGQQNLSYAAIAERLQLASADAARMRHARALLALREAWLRK